MKTMKQLIKERDRLTNALYNVKDLIIEKEKKTLIQCTDGKYGSGCGMGFSIKDLDYIQTYEWHGPDSMFDMGVWHERGGEFICPKCAHRNTMDDRIEIEDLKYCFKSIIDKKEVEAC